MTTYINSVINKKLILFVCYGIFCYSIGIIVGISYNKIGSLLYSNYDSQEFHHSIMRMGLPLTVFEATKVLPEGVKLAQLVPDKPKAKVVNYDKFTQPRDIAKTVVEPVYTGPVRMNANNIAEFIKQRYHIIKNKMKEFFVYHKL